MKTAVPEGLGSAVENAPPNVSTEMRKLPEGPGTTGMPSHPRGRYYRMARGSTGRTELPDGPSSVGANTPPETSVPELVNCWKRAVLPGDRPIR